MKIFTSFIFLVLISFCVFQGVSCGPFNYDLTRPIHLVLNLAMNALNDATIWLSSRATASYKSAANITTDAMTQAQIRCTKLREAADRLKTVSAESLDFVVAEITCQLENLSITSDVAEGLKIRINLLLDEIQNEEDQRTTSEKIADAVNNLQSEVAAAYVADPERNLYQSIQHMLLSRLSKVSAQSRNIIMWIDSNRVLFCISFVTALSIAFYISVKLSLAYYRVLIWLCIKMPYYVLKSIFKYLFGYSNDDEEFDLAENLEESCAVEAEDATSDSKASNTTYSQDEFLSSGLPRRALYGDDASYTPSLQDGKLNLKDYDLHVEIADSDMESENEEASTKGAPEDSSAVSVTFYSLSVAFAVVAFLF